MSKINDIPNIVVNRSGDTVTITVINQDDFPVFIYKAPETKSTFELLVNTSNFPYVDEIDEETSPKYKGSFGYFETIDDVTTKVEGVKSLTRYSRRE